MPFELPPSILRPRRPTRSRSASPPPGTTEKKYVNQINQSSGGHGIRTHNRYSRQLISSQPASHSRILRQRKTGSSILSPLDLLTIYQTLNFLQGGEGKFFKGLRKFSDFQTEYPWKSVCSPYPGSVFGNFSLSTSGGIAAACGRCPQRFEWNRKFQKEHSSRSVRPCDADSLEGSFCDPCFCVFLRRSSNLCGRNREPKKSSSRSLWLKHRPDWALKNGKF